jgi:hypothetical protein
VHPGVCPGPDAEEEEEEEEEEDDDDDDDDEEEAKTVTFPIIEFTQFTFPSCIKSCVTA